MKLQKFLCTLLACVSLVSCISVHASAATVENQNFVLLIEDLSSASSVLRASGSFNLKISAKSKVRAGTSFPLEAGETVRINASYSPDASLDFGLIGPDQKYHYVTVTQGNIDKTIRVNQRGNYTLQIRNNSSVSVSVSGYVNY